VFRWSIEDKLIWTSDALARLEDIRDRDDARVALSRGLAADCAIYDRIWKFNDNSSTVSMSVLDFLTAIMCV